MAKWKDKNELNILPNYGRYGKLYKSEKKSNKDKSLQKLLSARVVLILALTIVLSFTAYILTTRYIIPILELDNVSTFSDDEIEEEVLIDEVTGYTIYNEEDYLFVVNVGNSLDEDYEIELLTYENIQINQIIEQPLTAMVEQAEIDGITLNFSVGYVSPSEQQELYDEKLEELIAEGYTTIMANAKTEDFVAKPMESDNQTGLCVTIDADSETFEQSDTYNWLVKFAADYGFVFRYPSGKSDYTNTDANYLVLRYVGNEHAINMRQLGMCLEEYIAHIS